ncbi:BZ3500_MvSof-1268-A1-R1_Chr9g10580 [Microbotryum saponariae]|uniref:BZ3500_MvSof-1268-A1-R1_Chr9g10580 protein n=1 Tax=Microbotryum saponariae TaxID=289078 RepID=A0A2X0M654_9BASI|nr:BZ3501_MvSof-1269-A2-R1_Chr9g10328 [Microbotryum saponariae]SDA00331.1 BZ3500_MvSof-1268-A1-R1_Chr9g10580 [Microbotryum saponariae]
MVEITVSGILSDMDGTLVDSTAAVELTMTEWARANGHEPAYFLSHSHGVRTRDTIKRWQTVPKPGSEMSEDELDQEVFRIEGLIASNGRMLAERGERGIYELPGVHRMIKDLIKGGARWGIVTSATIVYASSALQTGKIKADAPDLPFIVTADNVTNGKPHPEPYLQGIKGNYPRRLTRCSLARPGYWQPDRALTVRSDFRGSELEKLSGAPFDPKTVLVFEDAPSGLASGLAAGCQTLAVCTGQTRERIRATDATYRTVDLERVEIVKCSPESITLRIRTLEEEEAEEGALGN